MKRMKPVWRWLVNNITFFTYVESLRYRSEAKFLNRISDTIKPKIHFIHLYYTNNTGDLACGYYQYCMPFFKDYNCVIHNIRHVNFNMIKKSDIVIVGGGGLINALNEWNYSINKAIRLAGKSILWSAGYNSFLGKCKIEIDFSRFTLKAIRDFNHSSGLRYVPCATCLSPLFMKQYDKKRRLGIVVHKNFKDVPEEIRGCQVIENTCSIEEMVSFIAESEVIVTSSYHAAYWSSLLKTKCVIFSVHSVKFEFFKYKPVVYSGNIEKDILDARVYDNALSESQKDVSEFRDQIYHLIESSCANKN